MTDDARVAAGPVTAGERFVSLDRLRGVAILVLTYGQRQPMR